MDSNSKNYKAVGSFLIIDPVKEELKNSLGMKMSSNDDFQIRYRRAKTISIGENVKNVKTGQMVFFDKNGAHQVIINGQTLSVVVERDIVLVEDEDSSS